MALNTDLRWFDKFSIDFTFLVYLRCMSCECRWMSQLMTLPKSVHMPSVYMCLVLNWSVESCYSFIDFEWWHVNTWRGVISKVWTSLEALFENVTNSQLGNKSSSPRLSSVPSLNAIGGDRLLLTVFDQTDQKLWTAISLLFLNVTIKEIYILIEGNQLYIPMKFGTNWRGPPIWPWT